MVDIDSIATVDDIRSVLQLLECEESQVDEELDELLHQVDELDPVWIRVITDLQLAVNQWDQRHLTPLAPKLRQSATLAAGIQKRVEELDAEKDQVHQAYGEVEQALELQRALPELRMALERGTLDQAAALVHRYLKVHSHILDSQLVTLVWAAATEDGVLDYPWWDAARGSDIPTPTASSDSPSVKNTRKLLERVRIQLAKLITSNFDQAVRDHDTKVISQCFKLFPLIQQENVGLDRYSKFLCETLHQPLATGDPSTRSGTVQRLTALFETVARAIDNHFPVVETHYGPGKMLRVMQYLQRDVDSRVNRIIELFQEDCELDRRLTEIKNYTAQISQDKASTSPVIPGKTNPLAVVGKHVLTKHAQGDTPLALARGIMDSITKTSQPGDRSAGTDTAGVLNTESVPPLVELKTLHPVVNDVAGVIQRLCLYRRFMESRAQSELEILRDADLTRSVFLDDDPRLQFDEVGLLKSGQLTSLTETIVTACITIENFILYRSVQLALGMDEAEQDNITSGWVDDVFFIVKRCLLRTLSTTHLVVIRNMVHTVEDLFNQVYIPFLLYQFQKLPSTTNPAIPLIPSVSHHGVVNLTKRMVASLPNHPEGTPSHAYADLALRNRFLIVALNNLDTSLRYTKKLIADLEQQIDPQHSLVWASHHDETVETTKKYIRGLCGVQERLSQLWSHLLEQFALLTARPTMRTILQESYRDFKYVLTDEEYMDVKNDNLFVQRFILKLDAFTGGMRKWFTESNFSVYIQHAVEYVATYWEKAVRLSKFNMLGAFCFDSDLRVIQQHLALVSSEPLRDKFTKLGQMADVLTLESPTEAKELWQTSQSTVTQYLTLTEFKNLLGNRIDFEDVSLDIAEL
ncbi:Golgi transport complex subunit 4 [Dispira parvispora]|uniref:Conserved oligomeric Golgi complex subunit 4 n=1 Tax=Dispira parvispora TaxID=1520584 RepID=A0A9W8E1K5_9FUNG|nr:Golgi transport complex subunit 4 [Dispira parvispora]